MDTNREGSREGVERALGRFCQPARRPGTRLGDVSGPRKSREASWGDRAACQRAKISGGISCDPIIKAPVERRQIACSSVPIGLPFIIFLDTTPRSRCLPLGAAPVIMGR